MNERKLSSLERVCQHADRLGLAIHVQRMDQTTRTAEDAARACGCDVGQIVKSLIFEDSISGRLCLLLISGSHNADTEFISATYGPKFVRCDARRVREETGFAIGGVAPIGHLAQPRVYMDSLLLTFPLVWCAAGRPDSVFSASPSDLRDATDAIVIEVAAGR